MKSCRLLCRKMIYNTVPKTFYIHTWTESKRKAHAERTLIEGRAHGEWTNGERKLHEWNWLSGCERRAHAKREGSANRNARWTVNALWTLDDRFVRITSEVIPWLLFKKEYILKSYALFSTNVCKNRRRANARQSSSNCLNWQYSRFFFCTALWVRI